MSISENPSRAARIRYRLLAVAIAVAAALLVWIVATLAGAHLEVTSPLAGTLTIDVLLTIAAALPAGLAAWGVLALLERLTPRARRIWTIVAVAVLVVSLPPLALLEANLGTKIVLAIMHVAVGLTLIVLLRRGARGAGEVAA